MKSIIANSTSCGLALVFGLVPSPVFADPGHIESAVDGHSHLLALGAVCAALVVGGLGLLHNIKLRKLDDHRSS